ncbi:MAG: HAD family hydrolase [Paracoccaceae bacterium]|nr:HAD family hydrolase [Paracoccaceae bacterium]
MPINGLLFDKDGTLFDFHHTWAGWAQTVIEDLSEGDLALRNKLAGAAGFNLTRRAFLADSPLIACTNRQAAEYFMQVLPHQDVDVIEARLTLSALDAPLTPVSDLPKLLAGFQTRGLKLGVMTNDSEAAARAHLSTAKVVDFFDFIAGFDSGYGVKPDPDPLLAFAGSVDLEPQHVVMIGDSQHDLEAGRAAGMQTVGVLTGMASKKDLASLADCVLPDISHLPQWIDGS